MYRMISVYKMRRDKIFRFDDVCINADLSLINEMTDFVFGKFKNCQVIWGISPLVHDMSNEKSETSRQRIFPKLLNAYSDYRMFYNVDRAGLPSFHPKITRAAHGLIHVDHRLLNKEVQELSILVSASLAKAKMFIPPFNKWNQHTEEICSEAEIELIKFEDGWLCMEYNNFNPEHDLWYVHSREFTLEEFKQWIEW